MLAMSMLLLVKFAVFLCSLVLLYCLFCSRVLSFCCVLSVVIAVACWFGYCFLFWLFVPLSLCV